MNLAQSVVTIGNFDGVHVGHAALLSRARQIGDEQGLQVLAMAFDPHPAATLRPETIPGRLTSFEQRRAMLIQLGADEVVRLEPTDELLGLEPRDFARWVVKEHRAACIVEGPDFHFGKDRKGNVDLLKEIGQAEGFEVQIVEPVHVAIENQSVVTASSSITRWLIEHGRVADAATVLGKPYEIEGRVIPGDRRGRELGFPTANLQTEHMLPADGVYAGVAILEDWREFVPAISVGDKPMFDGEQRIIEAHLLDVPMDGDLIDGVDEYGWPVRIRVMSWVRDQARFGSVSELTAQIGRDCQRVREIVQADTRRPRDGKGIVHART